MRGWRADAGTIVFCPPVPENPDSVSLVNKVMAGRARISEMSVVNTVRSNVATSSSRSAGDEIASRMALAAVVSRAEIRRRLRARKTKDLSVNPSPPLIHTLPVGE